MKVIPASRPKITKEETEKIIKSKLGAEAPSLVIVGIRGYYSKSMGATEGNDINLYDDACIVWGLDTFKTFNFNTDPSFVKKNGRALAKLNAGVYTFYKGKHRPNSPRGYDALRPYPEGVVLDCTREGKPAKCSLTNIHKGGMNAGSAGVTWSEGCQTLPPAQWDEFINLVYSKMTKLGMKTIKYILIDASEM